MVTWTKLTERCCNMKKMQKKLVSWFDFLYFQSLNLIHLQEWEEAYRTVAVVLGLPQDAPVPPIPRPDPVSLMSEPYPPSSANADGSEKANGGTEDSEMADGQEDIVQIKANVAQPHPPSLAFLSPEELAAPKLPSKTEMENILLDLRKKVLLEEYLGKET